MTDQIAAGDNAVGAILADGWNGEYFFGMPLSQGQRPFGGRRGFLMQLAIELADGTTRTIATDASWRCTRDGYVKGRGFQEPMMNSFNPWALGAVGEWIWRHVAGLNPDEGSPGWKQFTIAPFQR